MRLGIVCGFDQCVFLRPFQSLKRILFRQMPISASRTIRRGVLSGQIGGEAFRNCSWRPFITIPRSDDSVLVRTLAEFLGKRRITSLSISDTFRGHAPTVMEQLREVLSHQPTAIGFDVAGNCLYEEGLDIFAAILPANPRIIPIAFDEIELKNSLPLKRFFETLRDRPN
jgi:hypothetical protein